MELRERIKAATKQAMKDKDSQRLSTLRLISAAVKDRDIAARAEGNDDGVEDAELLSILAKMVKQRRESARTYEEGGRLDLAEAELAEIPVIEEFLPKPMSEDEVSQAVSAAVSEVGASSIRDMGRVMGVLKTRYQGRMDFGAVGPMVKDRLAAAG
ncbi:MULTISPECIES: GatB/YqeY domain-containing protein [Roseobacteraceae]|uniref:GatB/YqeY domain-containing protein n=1 Tax=Roseobacteraceae TaxID=2854170 RepID=UPI00080AA1D7|nr:MULTISPECIES: GatB/YqeY domain-containing protein [Roseobacteraceae]ANT62061.1 glutamyl-tRNA amidotransferase [Salipiger sp. CCB-MM3]MCA0997619.1 GatB/YqeY domain-containing protein [Alloyangia pacifica]NDV98893.1 GatB/YqeY domain-containing protein [Salipiger sp. PrR002]NDW55630.1 GatB/YqeY domain-containing protein [Salipiger sp. PrR004]